MEKLEFAKIIGFEDFEKLELRVLHIRRCRVVRFEKR
jgi:hypothetical protein